MLYIASNDQQEIHAVFTEQGASASQMEAAKFLDTVARMPGMGGQAADAVKVYIQVPSRRRTNFSDYLLNNALKHGYLSPSRDNQHHGRIKSIQCVP